MTRLLMRLFLKNSDNKNEDGKRVEYAVFAGVLGIVCNLLLFVLKFIVGYAASSIAVISDAFNNLSDMGTSAVSVIGAKLSGKRPDKEHPFGHGRMEYIASLIISFIIIMVGVELLKGSAEKIFTAEAAAISPTLLTVLCVSIPIKLWMFMFNGYLARTANISMLAAAARDSINDVIATGAVIFSAIVGYFFDFPQLDGLVGLAVSGFIIYSGFGISRDMIDVLLGSAPSRSLLENIKAFVLAAPEVTGLHDLEVHDYGPGRIMASVHAEVPSDCDIVEIHEVIDGLEKRIERELGVRTVVHLDPIADESRNTVEMREFVRSVVKEIDSQMDIHDFRMTDGINGVNLIFDIEVPSKVSNIDELKTEVTKKIKERNEGLNAMINIDFVS